LEQAAESLRMIKLVQLLGISIVEGNSRVGKN